MMDSQQNRLHKRFWQFLVQLYMRTAIQHSLAIRLFYGRISFDKLSIIGIFTLNDGYLKQQFLQNLQKGL